MNVPRREIGKPSGCVVDLAQKFFFVRCSPVEFHHSHLLPDSCQSHSPREDRRRFHRCNSGRYLIDFRRVFSLSSMCAYESPLTRHRPTAAASQQQQHLPLYLSLLVFLLSLHLSIFSSVLPACVRFIRDSLSLFSSPTIVFGSYTSFFSLGPHPLIPQFSGSSSSSFHQLSIVESIDFSAHICSSLAFNSTVKK